MIINLNEIAAADEIKFQGGDGHILFNRFVDEDNKIMQIIYPVGCSIGYHQHKDNCEIMYVISGEGEARTESGTEKLVPGVVHYCPRGGFHEVRNTGNTDLVVFAVVPKLG